MAIKVMCVCVFGRMWFNILLILCLCSTIIQVHCRATTSRPGVISRVLWHTTTFEEGNWFFRCRGKWHQLLSCSLVFFIYCEKYSLIPLFCKGRTVARLVFTPLRPCWIQTKYTTLTVSCQSYGNLVVPCTCCWPEYIAYQLTYLTSTK